MPMLFRKFSLDRLCYFSSEQGRPIKISSTMTHNVTFPFVLLFSHGGKNKIDSHQLKI